MEFAIARNWWVLALRGALGILFGAVAFFWPELVLLIVVYTFAAYAIFDGILALGLAFAGRRQGGPWWALVLEGVLGIGFGIVTFAWPVAALITELIVLYLIAYWLIVTGILQVVAAIRLRRYVRGEWALALAGVLSVILGVGMAIMPDAGLTVIAWWIGAYALVFGALLLALAFRLRSLAHGRTPTSARTDRYPAGAARA